MLAFPFMFKWKISTLTAEAFQGTQEGEVKETERDGEKEAHYKDSTGEFCLFCSFVGNLAGVYQ